MATLGTYLAKERGQDGVVVVVVVDKCLCDSGAIGGSFIGKDTLEKLEGLEIKF